MFQRFQHTSHSRLQDGFDEGGCFGCVPLARVLCKMASVKMKKEDGLTSLQRLGALQVLSDKSIEKVWGWAYGAAGTHGVCVGVDVDVVVRGRVKTYKVRISQHEEVCSWRALPDGPS